MKILFVCWANVGRSQMAASFYNHLTNTHDADAVGTEVELPGETLGDRRKRRGGTHVIDVMHESGIDITQNKKTQLTSQMLNSYDYVISMADKKYTPLWLSEHQKYEYWHVADPGSKGIETTRMARDKIEELIKSLINKLSVDTR